MKFQPCLPHCFAPALSALVWLAVPDGGLRVDEATLTGETFPVEKSVAVLGADTPLAREKTPPT